MPTTCSLIMFHHLTTLLEWAKFLSFSIYNPQHSPEDRSLDTACMKAMPTFHFPENNKLLDCLHYRTHFTMHSDWSLKSNLICFQDFWGPIQRIVKLCRSLLVGE